MLQQAEKNENEPWPSSLSSGVRKPITRRHLVIFDRRAPMTPIPVHRAPNRVSSGWADPIGGKGIAPVDYLVPFSIIFEGYRCGPYRESTSNLFQKSRKCHPSLCLVAFAGIGSTSADLGSWPRSLSA